jgi:signal transduction histidine kinase
MTPPRPRSTTSRSTNTAEWFASGIDLARLERLLLAYAVAPDGAGLANAALLCWNPQRDLLEGRWWWGRAIEPASRGASETDESERTRAVRGVAIGIEKLSESLATAWSHGVAPIGREEAIEATGGQLTGEAFVAVALRPEAGPFGILIGGGANGRAHERALVDAETFRRLAEAALTAHDRALERQRRQRHMAALVEYAHAGISDLNLAEVLSLLAKLATEATSARGGAVWLPGKDALQLEATAGPAGARERVARGLAPLAEACHREGRSIVLDKVTDDPRLLPESAAQLSAVAVVPLRSGHRGWGVLAVYDRAMFHPTESPAFDAADLEFLTALGDQSGLMLEHAARLDELKKIARRRDDLQAEVGRNERLAALGEGMAQLVQEIRNPLASIAAFAKRAHRGLPEDDPQREYLEIVIREAERLEHRVGEQMLAVQPRPSSLKLESLNAVVQEALQHGGEKLVRRRVRLLKKLSPDVPPLLLDAPRIGRVVTNILDHALDSVSPGGRVRVESRRVQDYVVVEIAHDGAHPAGDLLQQLFVPFSTSKTGHGVGLALAQQVVREHGGEIRVRSEAEWSSIFSFTIPVPINQDRRTAGRDRRGRANDRRKRPPAA